MSTAPPPGGETVRWRGFDVLDLVCGLVTVAVGGLVMLGATGYAIGELRRMGPGYLPLATGALLAGMGLAMVLASRRSASELPRLRLRPPLAVFAGLIFWALTIERLGLVPATAGLVVLVSLAQERPRLATILWTTAGLIAFSLIVFIYALRIPIDAFG